MKKKSLKGLSLNKMTISRLNQENFRGGKLAGTMIEGTCGICPADSDVCWPPKPPKSHPAPHCIGQGTIDRTCD